MLNPILVVLAVAAIAGYFLMILWTQFPQQIQRLGVSLLGLVRAAAGRLGARPRKA